MTSVPRETISIETFFDLENVAFQSLFHRIENPWEILKKDFLETWIQENIRPNVFHVKRSDGLVRERVEIETESGTAIVHAGCYLIGDQIELSGGVEIEAGSWVTGPTILGKNTKIRHGAYVRGGVVTGEAALIGHATEAKSSVFLNGAKAAHFAYVGNSILGNKVNLGAGTKISNLKITGDEVSVHIQGRRIPTGIRKLGGLLGDGVETGCNSVINPGALLAKKCMVYPCASVRNLFYPEGTRIK